MSKYLRFPVIENKDICLVISKGELIDTKEGTQFIMKKKQKRFEAYSLLDLLHTRYWIKLTEKNVMNTSAIEFQNENTILLALI